MPGRRLVGRMTGYVALMPFTGSPHLQQPICGCTQWAVLPASAGAVLAAGIAMERHATAPGAALKMPALSTEVKVLSQCAHW